MLVVSEELDELFEICDRLHRDRPGPAVAVSVPIAEATIEQIGEWMAGLWADAAAQRRQEAAMLKLEARPQPSQRDGAGLAAARAG